MPLAFFKVRQLELQPLPAPSPEYWGTRGYLGLPGSTLKQWITDGDVNPLPVSPEHALVLAKFIGGLLRRREQAGLSLTDVADRSGIDKAALSRLENGFYPNPTINTLARYAKAIGKRFVPALED
jgi:DNA-binding XRE family transcriptional regulator